jgi:hypothetical protein
VNNENNVDIADSYLKQFKIENFSKSEKSRIRDRQNRKGEISQKKKFALFIRRVRLIDSFSQTLRNIRKKTFDITRNLLEPSQTRNGHHITTP